MRIETKLADRGLVLPEPPRPPPGITLSFAWWSQSRLAAVPVGLCETKMNPMACAAYVESMELDRAPWPWELKHELTMATYLDWALANGLVSG